MDHPRTRGVYENSVGVNLFQIRIIPAHAGFTPPGSCGPGSGPDHPRTRGVYQGADPGPVRAPGSSPHTRGLHRQGHECGAAHGIIPAHAGFTMTVMIPRPWTSDHPRTRGVYARVARRLGTVNRIIPAHAGFTSPRQAGTRCRRDHPRTRGVYPVSESTSVRTWGSSPHTRGLQGVGGLLGDDAGIIPAHAGFTVP